MLDARPAASSQAICGRDAAKKPIVIVDAYYDGEGYALCPAATGFTNHIGPWGDIEPCPVIQIAGDSIYDERPLKDVFGKSEFLKDFRETAAGYTRGCIVLERPDLLLELAERHGAKDTTIRKTVFEELRNMEPRPRSTTPEMKCPKRTWSTVSLNGCGSTTMAPMASTSKPISGRILAASKLSRRASGHFPLDLHHGAPRGEAVNLGEPKNIEQGMSKVEGRRVVATKRHKKHEASNALCGFLRFFVAISVAPPRQPNGVSNRPGEPKNIEQGMSKEEGSSPRKDTKSTRRID